MQDIHQVGLGHVVFDDIRFADGHELTDVLGGAGSYAAAGQALVLDDGLVGLVSGVGADFPAAQLASLTAGGIDVAGLVVRDPRTPRTSIEYFEDGEREETARHGLEHFAALDPTADMLPVAYRSPRGIYVFDEIDPALFTDLAALRDAAGSTLLWEIHAGACRPELFDAVAAQLAQVDLLSINRTEARALCGTDDLTVCLARLRDAGAGVVALRLGSSGALVVDGEDTYRARPPAGAVVDPTGAGNAFSGAFVAAWSEPARPDPAAALRAAMAASALTIRQLGPPTLTPALRTEHRALAATIDVVTGDMHSLQDGHLL